MNLNRVFLAGRLTRDPESRSFANGGKVTNMGLAVSNWRKDASGQWQDEPAFIDVSAFNGGSRELADKAAGLVKGQEVVVEGKLVMDQWEDKGSGQKRTKLKVVADNIQPTQRQQREEPARAPAPAPVTPEETDNQLPF